MMMGLFILSSMIIKTEEKAECRNLKDNARRAD